MRRAPGLLLAVALLAGCGGGSTPVWLKHSGRSGLRFYLGGAKPVHERYVVGRDRAVAAYRLGGTVVCGGCSCPSARTCPQGDGLTLVFSRRTHRLLQMSLCDAFTEGCPGGLGGFRP